jgi:hypothetical protein
MSKKMTKKWQKNDKNLTKIGSKKWQKFGQKKWLKKMSKKWPKNDQNLTKNWLKID